eukprot:3495950-Pleurochrysis_carterae.AAC.1
MRQGIQISLRHDARIRTREARIRTREARIRTRATRPLGAARAQITFVLRYSTSSLAAMHLGIATAKIALSDTSGAVETDRVGLSGASRSRDVMRHRGRCSRADFT